MRKCSIFPIGMVLLTLLSCEDLPITHPVVAEKISDNNLLKGCHASDVDLQNGAVQAYVLVDGARDTANYNFYWYSGAVVKNTPDHAGAVYSGLVQGTYTVHATHKTNGTSDIATIDVGQIDSIAAEISIVIEDTPDTSCDLGNPVGQLKVVINGEAEASTEHDIAWYIGNNTDSEPFGIGQATITGLSQGAYTVLVTDKNTGCQATKTLSVSKQELAVAIMVDSPNSRCLTNPVTGNGKLHVEINGTVESFANYDIKWFKGDEAVGEPFAIDKDTVSQLVDGMYTVLVIDRRTGCQKTSSLVVVKHKVPVVAEIVIDAHNTNCGSGEGNGKAHVIINGANGPFTYFEILWFKGADLFTSPIIGTEESITELAGGIYAVVVEDIETNCFTSRAETILDDCPGGG